MALRATESRGYAIAYEDFGDGPTAVLVNGLAPPAAEWRERGYVHRRAGRVRSGLCCGMRATGDGLGVEPHVLSGNHDHFTAFADAASVVPPVLAHLEAIGAW